MSPNNLYLGCTDSASYTHKKSLNITEISFHSLMVPKFPLFSWGKKKREKKKKPRNKQKTPNQNKINPRTNKLTKQKIPHKKQKPTPQKNPRNKKNTNQILRNENFLWREHWFYRISTWVGCSIRPSPVSKYNWKQGDYITVKGRRGGGSVENAL